MLSMAKAADGYEAYSQLASGEDGDASDYFRDLKGVA